MPASHRLSIVTPAAVKFEGDVELVIAPGAAGDIGIMAHHAPLLTTLRTGVVTVKRSSGSDAAEAPRLQFAVERGFLQAFANSVTILTDVALSPGDVNVEDARADLQRAEEGLAQKRGQDDAAERNAAAWARARLALIARPV